VSTELIHLRDTKQQIILRAWRKVVVIPAVRVCVRRILCLLSAAPGIDFAKSLCFMPAGAVSLSVPFQFAEMSHK